MADILLDLLELAFHGVEAAYERLSGSDDEEADSPDDRTSDAEPGPDRDRS